MISKQPIKFFLVFFSAASLWLVTPVQAQYSRFGGGSNQYGGGYNQYGGGYNQYGGGNSQYGSSRFGGGSSQYGGGYNQYGGGNNQFGGGFGSSMRGSSRSGRSGRSGRGSNQYGGNQSYGNQGYDNQGYGNSSSRSGRSRRGGNYSNQTYGGNVSNSAATQGGQAKQTSPTGNSTDRRKALSGKSNVRGAMSGPSASQGSGGLQIQGAVGGSPVAKGSKGKPAPKRNEPKAKMRSTSTLYLDCASPMAVVNQPKTISIILTNNSLEYDYLSFALQYDPDDVMPISGQDAAGEWIAADKVPMVAPDVSDATDSLGGESTFISRNPGKYEIINNTIDLQTGEIRFEMKVKNGASKEGGEIAQLVFLPLRESNTTISFVFQDLLKSKTDKPLTILSLSNIDQLGSKHNKADGVINIDLQIFDTLEKARKRMVVKKAGDDIDTSDEKEENQSYETKLSLVARSNSLDVGDTVDIDVVLSNPGRETIDAVNLLIAYNPRVFEAIDGDDFAPGVNIADQEYKEQFPLDFPILNIIDEDKGIIDYRKKSMRKSVTNEGVIATIKLRAIHPTKKTTFRLFLSESGEEPTTGLFFRHNDRLGDPTDPYDGVRTCSLAVRPTTAFLKKFR